MNLSFEEIFPIRLNLKRKSYTYEKLIETFRQRQYYSINSIESERTEVEIIIEIDENANISFQPSVSRRRTIAAIRKINSKISPSVIALMEIREIMKTRGRRPKYVLVAGSSENLCSSRRSTTVPHY